MVTDYRCFFCFAKAFSKLLENEPITNEAKNKFTNEMLWLYQSKGSKFSAPEFSRELHTILRQYTGNTDPYKNEKKHCNDLVMKMSAVLKKQIYLSRNPFDTALRLAIAGNIIDYGVDNNFDLYRTIDKVQSTDFAIDHSKQLKKAIEKAKTVLYLGDNAGEIVFDKLLLENLEHPNLYFAVRGAPVINDATIEDAQYVGIDKVAKIISNGYDAPSTILEHCSKEFIDIYKKADVIISKGQGNLEGLYKKTDKEVYFLLMVKCHVIAENLGVKKGSFVVKHNMS